MPCHGMACAMPACTACAALPAPFLHLCPPYPLCLRTPLLPTPCTSFPPHTTLPTVSPCYLCDADLDTCICLPACQEHPTWQLLTPSLSVVGGCSVGTLLPPTYPNPHFGVQPTLLPPLFPPTHTKQLPHLPTTFSLLPTPTFPLPYSPPTCPTPNPHPLPIASASSIPFPHHPFHHHSPPLPPPTLYHYLHHHHLPTTLAYPTPPAPHPQLAWHGWYHTLLGIFPLPSFSGGGTDRMDSGAGWTFGTLFVAFMGWLCGCFSVGDIPCLPSCACYFISNGMSKTSWLVVV